ncbi:MAG: bifunctional 5,10-methylenetetrahydrofolate dehydrogenase/5,10-methenyltetrahydrofolate cyclohydrolase [Candidatus Marinimicrobia bacterium]|nr:bifunctional 5,10-methylenetetrahydrofolate dehydrogenase/5,10-methenyltetrahydrofolate cyclohydrolase [Candidatus Neomarinimicrobiota bacterium]
MIDTRLLSGKDVSQAVYTTLDPRIQSLKQTGIVPSLAVILVGDDAPSKVYVKSKSRQFAKMGLKSETIPLPEATSEAGLISFIDELNQDSSFHGILVQLPLPAQIRSEKVIRAISPEKDVDGFHPENLGLLTSGQPRFIPCTPKGILKIISHYKINPSGKHVVVLGRSNIVGRPMSILLSSKNENGNGTVTLCHSSTPDIKTFSRQADILIVALGVPKLITKTFVKKGAVIIDVGIHRIPNNSEKGYEIVGDVDRKSIEGKVSAITPVPGGVGPMTIAMLVENTVEAAEIQST